MAITSSLEQVRDVAEAQFWNGQALEAGVVWSIVGLVAGTMLRLALTGKLPPPLVKYGADASAYAGLVLFGILWRITGSTRESQCKHSDGLRTAKRDAALTS